MGNLQTIGLLSALFFLGGSFLAVGNTKIIGEIFKEQRPTAAIACFWAVWRNSILKLLLLFIIGFGVLLGITTQDPEAWMFYTIPLLGIVFGALFGFWCAVAAGIGAALGERPAKMASVVVLYAEIFAFAYQTVHIV